MYMKAVVVREYGGSEKLEISDTAEPTLKTGQVLVKVHAASINPFDIKILSGMYKDSMPMHFPYTPGGDFSGVVEELAQGVTEYRVGDDIYGSALTLNGGSGAFAEVAAVNIKNSAVKPSRVNHGEAASLPLVGSSAVQALEEHIGLQAGQKILIHGGAGGIGSIAIQLAKHMGAYVATTVSEHDKEFVVDLGADQTIDYKNERFEELVRDFDAAFDTVGGETLKRSFGVLRKGGILVSMLGAPDENLATKYGITGIGQGTHTNREHLTRLTELIDKGVIRPQVDKVFPLTEIREAFEYTKNGHPRGKVLLKILD